MVSILVLVDVALEPDRAQHGRPQSVGFNPCSRGCRSGTPVHFPPDRIDLSGGLSLRDVIVLDPELLIRL